MKDIKNIEQIEKNTFECMDWMENRVKNIVEDFMKMNSENLKHIETDYDKGYMEGIHDGLLDLLKALDIDTDEEYYN